MWGIFYLGYDYYFLTDSFKNCGKKSTQKYTGVPEQANNKKVYHISAEFQS